MFPNNVDLCMTSRWQDTDLATSLYSILIVEACQLFPEFSRTKMKKNRSVCIVNGMAFHLGASLLVNGCFSVTT